MFLFSSKNDLLMVEYNKYCLRYRYFLIFKNIEKFLLYFLDIFNIKFKKSKVLTPDLDIIKNKILIYDIFKIEKKYFNKFDVVRITNLLNYAYFTKNKLKLAIINIKNFKRK